MEWRTWIGGSRVVFIHVRGWLGARKPYNDGNTIIRRMARLDGNDASWTAWASVEDGGSNGWQPDAFTFTAVGASVALGFLAEGLGGSPAPFALLDNVQWTPVIESAPGEDAGVFGGLALFAGVAPCLRAAKAR